MKSQTKMNIPKLHHKFSELKQRGLLNGDWNCKEGFNNFVKWNEIYNPNQNLEIHRIRIGEIKINNKIFPQYSKYYSSQTCECLNRKDHRMKHLLDRSGFTIIDIYQIKISLRDEILNEKELAKKFDCSIRKINHIKNQKCYANIKL